MKTCFLFCLIILPSVVTAQDAFDDQIKKLSVNLANKVKLKGKQKVGVVNFYNLESHVTALGKYIAEQLSVELVNTDLDIVDRANIDRLMQDQKMKADGLLDPKTVAKLGNMAGVEVIITGTITPMDNSIKLTVKATDVTRGIVIAAEYCAVPRTESINDLLGDRVGDNTTGLELTRSKLPDNQSPINTLFQAKISTLPEQQCMVGGYTYGVVCFRNEMKIPIIIESITTGNGSSYFEKITLPVGGENCSPSLLIGSVNLGPKTHEYSFNFTTVGESTLKKGTLRFMVDQCKAVAIVLNPNRLYLSKQ